MNSPTQTTIIRVWPLWLRVLHWLLVTAFLISYLTGDDYRSVHVWSGYLMVALLLLRVGLGLASKGYGGLSGWHCSPLAAFNYIKSLVRGDAHRYLGHNPAGACMAVLLVLMLSLTLASGLVLHGVHGHGPLASLMTSQPGATANVDMPAAFQFDEDEDEDEDSNTPGNKSENESAEEFWEETHELFVNLVPCHASSDACRAWHLHQGKAQFAGNGTPLPRTATQHWCQCQSPCGPGDKWPSAVLHSLELAQLVLRSRAWQLTASSLAESAV